MKIVVVLSITALLTACTSAPLTEPPNPSVAQTKPQEAYSKPRAEEAKPDQRNEVVMYAMSLLERGYRFGGGNPESGLDCSGMVSYIYQQATGLQLPHNAAKIAAAGREINVSELSPGDLVFFNTNGKPYSHVGIYIGDDRFIHAPKTDGKIKISSLKSSYFEKRLVAARTFFTG